MFARSKIRTNPAVPRSLPRRSTRGCCLGVKLCSAFSPSPAWLRGGSGGSIPICRSTFMSDGIFCLAAHRLNHTEYTKIDTLWVCLMCSQPSQLLGMSLRNLARCHRLATLFFMFSIRRLNLRDLGLRP